MPKKITAVLMLIVLCVGLCACGGNNPAKSDLAVIDTETNESIYIGQPKDEIEELYGVGEYNVELLDLIQYSYCDGSLKLGFDEQNYVDFIQISSSLNKIGFSETTDSEVINNPNRKNLIKEERFKTYRGVKIRNINSEFRDVYKVDNDFYEFIANDKVYWVQADSQKNIEQIISNIWISEKTMLFNGRR